MPRQQLLQSATDQHSAVQHLQTQLADWADTAGRLGRRRGTSPKQQTLQQMTGQYLLSRAQAGCTPARDAGANCKASVNRPWVTALQPCAPGCSMATRCLLRCRCSRNTQPEPSIHTRHAKRAWCGFGCSISAMVADGQAPGQDGTRLALSAGKAWAIPAGLWFQHTPSARACWLSPASWRAGVIRAEQTLLLAGNA